MSYDDKFPPNAFMKRTLFRSPGRFLLYAFGFVALELVSGKYFPHQTATVALWGLCVLMPVSLGMSIWHLVWAIKNKPPAPPPPKYCDTCHQRLPHQDNQ